MKAVDPVTVNEALAGVSSGLIAVVATLRLQFAHTAVLAAAIGDVFFSTLDRFLREPLQSLVAPEYHKWVPVGLRWLARTVAMSAAYTAQRVISAFHSSIRGAQVCMDTCVCFSDVYACVYSRMDVHVCRCM